MVCYIVPLAATLAGIMGRKALKKEGSHGFWLNLMLLGGALFGVIDHFWNGELFLIGTNWVADIALGGTITAGILASWGVIVYKERLSEPFRFLTRVTGIFR
jgi:hypothetical protein